MDSTLEQQIRFILEIDKLKSVIRRTYIPGTSRKENDAEHSWHLAVMAMVLSEYANEKIDINQVIKMVLIHDIVEIKAGDTFCYDTAGAAKKAEKEKTAAQEIYGLLPREQQLSFLQTWEEFEKGKSAEAKFARALDRLMPMLHNYFTEGKAWQEHGITKSQVVERNAHIAEGSTELWEYAKEIIEDAVSKGYLQR
jgi:putative hydrolase of HD superfamily